MPLTYSRLFAKMAAMIPLTVSLALESPLPHGLWAWRDTCFGQWGNSKCDTSRDLKNACALGFAISCWFFCTQRPPCEETCCPKRGPHSPAHLSTVRYMNEAILDPPATSWPTRTTEAWENLAELSWVGRPRKVNLPTQKPSTICLKPLSFGVINKSTQTNW